MTLTRRELLKLGAGAGLSLAVGWRPALGRGSEPLTKPIPSSGEMVPVVGLGMRNYRVGPTPEERAPFKATLKVFAELGGKVLDTAPSYGNSESVLGDLMGELGFRDQVFVASKVDREGRDEGIARMEESFQKIKTDRIDLMQVHNLRDTATQLTTIREWKDRGRFRYAGITTSRNSQYGEMERIMSSEELDFIQINYSLGVRAAADRILPLAEDRGMAVLVNLPFGRGRLFNFVGDRPLPDWAAEIDCETWAQVFLKHVISHPAVTCVIPGTTKDYHAVDNMGAAAGRMPDAALRRHMEEYYDSLGASG